MRRTTKSNFYDLFTELNISVNDNNTFSYVIDGAMLWHRWKWQLEEKFVTTRNHYIRYLRNNYGNNVFVVFDAYRNTNWTKSAERYRRSLKNTSTDVIFDENIPLRIRQEKTIANSGTKRRFIEMSRKKLADNNISSYQSEGDADTLIIQTTINIEIENVVVVAEDIDVLVLLTALAPPHREIYFLKPEKGTISAKIYSNKSLVETLQM